MDGQWAIERNRLALKAILAGLVAMVMSANSPHPEVLAVVGEPRRTLPRRLHCAVLRLLRPAESAARRLIVALARGIAVPPPPPRSAWSSSPASQGVSSRFAEGKSVVPVARWKAGERRVGAEHRAPGSKATDGMEGAAPHRPSPPPMTLPLFDRLRRPSVRRIPGRDLPRICVPGYTDRRPVPLLIPPSPTDPIDATRLSRRLDALARALDDLPAHARRFARWRARQASSHRRRTRLWPLRLGPPPGRRTPNSRLPAHEVDDVLASSHELAMEALEQPHPS